MAVKVPFIFQDNTIRYYVCANCWGDLYKHFTGERGKHGEFIFDIDCETEGCPCNGFVSRHFTEQSEVIARVERYDAWRDLKDILPWVKEKGPVRRTDSLSNIERPHRSTQTILAELGF